MRTGQAFELKPRDYDLHIALAVSPERFEEMRARGKAAGIETRGPADHGFTDSISFRNPDGYVIELTAKRADHDAMMDPQRNGARDRLAARQKTKGTPGA